MFYWFKKKLKSWANTGKKPTTENEDAITPATPATPETCLEIADGSEATAGGIPANREATVDATDETAVAELSAAGSEPDNSGSQPEVLSKSSPDPVFPAEATGSPVSGAKETEATREKRTAIPRLGRIQLRQRKDGDYFFTVYAANGVQLAYSRSFYTREACRNGIEAFRREIKAAACTTSNAGSAGFEVYQDTGEAYRFRFRNQNGTALLYSHGYRSRAGCRAGIKHLRQQGDAPLTENEIR